MDEKTIVQWRKGELPVPHETRNQFDQLVQFINIKHNCIERPLVMKSNAQKLDHLLGTGKEASSLAGIALKSLAS